MKQQLREPRLAVPQHGVVAVGDPDRHARPAGQSEIEEGEALIGVQVDEPVVPLPQQTPEAAVILRSVQPAGKLHQTDPGLPKAGGKDAFLQLFGHEVHLQPAPVHVQQHIAEKGLDPAGLPALANDTDPPRHSRSLRRSGIIDGFPLIIPVCRPNINSELPVFRRDPGPFPHPAGRRGGAIKKTSQPP